MELKTVSEEFKTASEMTNITLTPVSEQERIKILESIYSKYGKDSTYRYPFWEYINNYIGVSFPYAWNWFNEILEEKEVIFFFELGEDKNMFQIQNGGDIPEILEECYRFNFYLSNKEASFILTYNDHENLIAGGEAIEWIYSYIKLHNLDLKIYKSY